MREKSGCEEGSVLCQGICIIVIIMTVVGYDCIGVEWALGHGAESRSRLGKPNNVIWANVVE